MKSAGDPTLAFKFPAWLPVNNYNGDRHTSLSTLTSVSHLVSKLIFKVCWWHVCHGVWFRREIVNKWWQIKVTAHARNTNSSLVVCWSMSPSDLSAWPKLIVWCIHLHSSHLIHRILLFWEFRQKLTMMYHNDIFLFLLPKDTARSRCDVGCGTF